MAQVLQFVILTVRQPLEGITEQMESVNQEGAGSHFLWGWKRDAFANIDEHQDTIYRDAMAIWSGYIEPAAIEKELLRYFADLPGFGLAKAGFVIQLCFGLSGCIDSHNLARFNISYEDIAASRFKRAKTPKTRNRLLDLYCELVHQCGGTAALWDGWCEYVAGQRPAAFTGGAHEVSALHCEAIGA
jgi:hypothetical protein